MSRQLIDEIHLSLFVAADMPPKQALAIVQTLKSARFQRALRQHVAVALRRFPLLKAITSRLSR